MEVNSCGVIDDLGSKVHSVWQVSAMQHISQEIREWETENKDLFAPDLMNDEVDWTTEDEVSVTSSQQSLFYHSSLNIRQNHGREYELVVDNELQQCANLVTSLTQTADELRDHSQIIYQKERELENVESTLRIEFDLKLQKFQETSRRMEDDFKLEVTSLKLERERLEKEVWILRNENDSLRKTAKEQYEEIRKLRKSSLTEDQTTSLLKELKAIEEKYENAYRSKLFFKEQWANAAREVHLLRSRRSEEIALQILYNREELRTFGRMLPDPNLYKESSSQSSEKHYGDHCTTISESEESSSSQDLPTPNKTLHKSDSECKLQQLVQERDTLLNTGNYDLEHVLIRNLNKEIREMLSKSNSKFI